MTSETTARTVEQATREWWKEAVFYQVYPRSFNDTDGDGIGDLPGITERADYLADLGVDAVWLCPIYESPQRDNGYDISDYRAIDDRFGDLGDFDELLSALHDRNIRLVMDLVVNHTSDAHEWFQRSRRGEPPYDEYYIWREGDPETPPNNWESIFGGSAWSYDDHRGAWYLHLFGEHQPDLNWRSPAVRDAITDVTEWWLDRGIDGFRIDAVSHIAKAEGLPDGDPDSTLVGSEQFTHAPGFEEYLTELCAVFDGYDAVSVGELGRTSIEETAAYTGAEGPGLDVPFQFDHVHAGYDPANVFDPTIPTEWDFQTFKRTLATQQRSIPWPAVFFSNHDLPRLVSRIGDDEAYRRESATVIATALLTLRGTPFVYQGDEIGMRNVSFESLADVDDAMAVGQVRALLEEGRIDTAAVGLAAVNEWSRDHSRTPMQWTDGPNAGFTDGEPWLPIGADYESVNVEAARADERSIWHYYRDLIALRSEEDVLVYGDFELYYPDHESVFAYTRSLAGDRVLVALNWAGKPVTESVPDGIDRDTATLLVGNYADADGRDLLDLRPWDARVYRL